MIIKHSATEFILQRNYKLQRNGEPQRNLYCNVIYSATEWHAATELVKLTEFILQRNCEPQRNLYCNGIVSHNGFYAATELHAATELVNLTEFLKKWIWIQQSPKQNIFPNIDFTIITTDYKHWILFHFFSKISFRKLVKD